MCLKSLIVGYADTVLMDNGIHCVLGYIQNVTGPVVADCNLNGPRRGGPHFIVRLGLQLSYENSACNACSQCAGSDEYITLEYYIRIPTQNTTLEYCIKHCDIARMSRNVRYGDRTDNFKNVPSPSHWGAASRGGSGRWPGKPPYARGSKCPTMVGPWRGRPPTGGTVGVGHGVCPLPHTYS